MTPLKKAIGLAGGYTALAKELDIHRVSVHQWDICPADRVLQVCAAVDWRVTPHELRPDLYPNPSDALPMAKAA